MTGMFKDSSSLAAPCGGDALAGAESSFSEARADSQLVAGPTSQCLRGSSTPSTCEAASVLTSHDPLQDFAIRYPEDLGVELSSAPFPAALTCIETNRATS